MKTSIATLLGIAILSGMAAAQTPDAQATGGTIPYKARVTGELASAVTSGRASNGTVRMVFTIFDSASGGTKLFEEAQSIRVSGDLLIAQVGSATRGGIPASVMHQHSNFYIEAARASAPWSPLASTGAPQRQLVAFKPSAGSNASPNAVSISIDPAACFTCGGTWPYFAGAWHTPSPTSGTYEHSSACGGALVSTTDTFPFLCSR